MRNALLLTAALGLALAGCSGTQLMPAGTIRHDGTVAAASFRVSVDCKPGVEIPEPGWRDRTIMCR